jgi:hypothetical protein
MKSIFYLNFARINNKRLKFNLSSLILFFNLITFHNKKLNNYASPILSDMKTFKIFNVYLTFKVATLFFKCSTKSV